MERLSLEDRLLLCCASNEMSERATEKLDNLLACSLDWNYILNEAVRHGIAPLLHNHLKEAENSIPGEILKHFKKEYYKTVGRHTLFFYEARKVLKALADVGIQAIILKGLALANVVYKNPAFRPFSDIDLLILKKDLPKAVKALEGLDYALPKNLLPIEVYDKFHFHLQLLKKDGRRFEVELHWCLTDHIKYAAIETLTLYIWNNIEQVEISGVPLFIMQPEDLLLYLCFHLNKHGYMNNFICYHEDNRSFVLKKLSQNRLIWFVDINEVIKYYGERINWDNLIRKSKKWDENGCVSSGLYIVDWLFEAKLDIDILRNLPPAKSSPLENIAFGFLVNRYNRKGENDSIIKYFEKNILRMNEKLQFRPIRLISLNPGILIHYILFPLQMLFYIIKKKFSDLRHG